MRLESRGPGKAHVSTQNFQAEGGAPAKAFPRAGKTHVRLSNKRSLWLQKVSEGREGRGEVGQPWTRESPQGLEGSEPVVSLPAQVGR